MHHFESELDDLRRVVYRAPGALLGMDRATWDARIGDIETRAHEAYRENDAAGWRRCFNEVQALYETAVQEEFASMRLDDPVYLARRLAGVVRYANRVERSLADFIPSVAEEVRARQLAERDRLLEGLRAKVATPLEGLATVEGEDPAALRRRLEAMSAELERIEGAVERLPSLGLVTERG
jgi:molecular chaperone DnaK